MLIVLIVVLVLLFGGGGYYGFNSGAYGAPVLGGIGIGGIILILVVIWALGGT